MGIENGDEFIMKKMGTGSFRIGSTGMRVYGSTGGKRGRVHSAQLKIENGKLKMKARGRASGDGFTQHN